MVNKRIRNMHNSANNVSHEVSFCKKGGDTCADDQLKSLFFHKI